MTKLRTVLRWVDTFSRWQGEILCFSFLSLIGFTIYDIIARQWGWYTMWAFDVGWFHNAFLLSLTLGYSLLIRSYVKVDVLSTRYPPRVQHLLMFLTFLLIGIPITILFASLAWHWAMRAWEIKEVASSASRIPIYHVKMFIFVGFVLSLPQLFAETIRHGYFLFKKVEL